METKTLTLTISESGHSLRADVHIPELAATYWAMPGESREDFAARAKAKAAEDFKAYTIL